MRTVAHVAALALTLAACGSTATPSAERAEDTLPAPVTSTAPTIADDASPPDTAEPDTTEPGTRPVTDPALPDGQRDDSGSSGPEPLSIEDALLPGDALPAPWELQRRELERVGYGAGPNQTDCDEYWEYESLLGADGGHAMWWTDGGNANHHVLRMPDQGAIVSTLVAIGSIADECPTVRWLEGGSFTSERFEFDDSLALRFVDEEGNAEVTWVVLTSHGDLISLLQMPLWTGTAGGMPDVALADLERLGARMRELLERAGPARVDPERPPGSAPPTTELPRIEPPPIEPPVTMPPVTMPPVTSPPVSGLGELLLADGEPPGGWELDGVDVYEAAPPDDPFGGSCPAVDALNRIDAVLEWEAEFESVSGREAFEMIGPFDDSETATAAVEEFAEIADCDFAWLSPSAIVGGGALDVPGADAAASLFFEVPDLDDTRFETVVVAVGRVVAVFSFEADATDEPAGHDAIEFATRGVAKIAAG